MNTSSIFAYGASTFGKTLLWATLDVYGLYSLTALIGMAPATASAFFLFLLLWSALTDAAVGWLIDRHLSASATNALMRLSAPTAGLFFVFGFAPMPGGLGAGGAMAAAMLFRLFFSSFDVPHNTLLQALSSKPERRRTLSAVRLFSTIAASYCVGFVALWMLPKEDAGAQADDYLRFAAAIAGIGSLVFLLTPDFAGADHGVASSRESSRAHKLQKRKLWEIFCAMTIGVIGVSLFLKSLPFVAHGDFSNPRWAGQALIALTTGRLVGLALWQIVGRTMNALTAGVVAYGASACAAGILWASIALGFPLAPGLVLLGAAMAGVSLFSWVITADLADGFGGGGSVARSGVFGLFTGLSKMAVGVGGSLLGLWLATPQVRILGTLEAACLVFAGLAMSSGLLLSRWRTGAPSKASSKK